MFKKLQDIFALYRKVFCACKCGCVFRLSDTQLIDTSKDIRRDWLSNLQIRQQRLEERIALAEERLENQRELIIQRNRRAAQRHANQVVETIVPRFQKLNLNTQDVKAIFHPIYFLVFDGLSDRNISRIRLLDTPPNSKTQEQRHIQIRKALKAGNLNWKTIRIGDDGSASED